MTASPEDNINPITLSLFSARVAALCEEMGAALRRAAFSPNIRDRLDYSCAVFDQQGQLCAQAAHIPVHLGSMAFAMADVVRAHQWQSGDQLIFNDPFLGGTHLPDITIVAPVFLGRQLVGFVANRAHHADVGAEEPGSMPMSRTLQEEGMIIPPTLIEVRGVANQEFLNSLNQCLSNPQETGGDLAAQLSANRIGVARLTELAETLAKSSNGPGLRVLFAALNDYAERVARAALQAIPDGQWEFDDALDNDGFATQPIPLRVRLKVRGDEVEVDLRDCAEQVNSNLNCPLPVTVAAVYYVFRCLMPEATPSCAGSMRPLSILTRAGSLVDARRPAAVVAGNVETSQRIVDLILGALAQALPERIPAASQGTMNNVAMGSHGSMDTLSAAQPGSESGWAYYETLGGGAGGGPQGAGLSGRHSHMTNTLNTPVEVLESHYPLRLNRYALREGSGGQGIHPGGDGIEREYEFLDAARVTVLSERRVIPPWGLAGGAAGACGSNRLDGREMGGKLSLAVKTGQRLLIQTPGGGGWGTAD